MAFFVCQTALMNAVCEHLTARYRITSLIPRILITILRVLSRFETEARVHIGVRVFFILYLSDLEFICSSLHFDMKVSA